MVIDARGISLVYDSNTETKTYALKSVDISIKSGEFVGVIGPSGSGKSSLLYLLSGLKKPTSGTVYYDDVDIESYSDFQKACIRKERFGFIFQKHFLIDPMSVRDNVLVPLNESGREAVGRADAILDTLGIGHIGDKKPYQLSGGQRQRVAVARAIINHPSVIFADEPTASLDHDNAREVMRILRDSSMEATVFVATHDKSILKNADRIIELWDGKMI